MSATNEKVSYVELITNGLLKENPIFRLALSLCPAIAVTNNLKNGVFMGLAVVVVQVMVNLTISAMRSFISPRIRLPIFMLVISGWVTVVNLVMDAAVPDVYKDVGLYIQLIVAFASILARAEMFASKNPVVPSAFDGIGSAGGHKSMGRAEIKQNALPQGLLLSDNRGVEEFVLSSLARHDPVFIPIQKSIRI